MREQRERVRAEKARDEALGRLKAREPDAAALLESRALWAQKKYLPAMKAAFGASSFEDDLLVALASGSEEPKPLTPEQMREQIRAQLEEERATRESEVATHLQGLRNEATKAVGQHLVDNPTLYPSLWRKGISAEAIGAAMDKAGWGAEPATVFAALEAEERAGISALPWFPKAAEPTAAPRSWLSSRGPTDAAPEAKPMTAEEREKAREQRYAEFRVRNFGGGAK